MQFNTFFRQKKKQHQPPQQQNDIIAGIVVLQAAGLCVCVCVYCALSICCIVMPRSLRSQPLAILVDVTNFCRVKSVQRKQRIFHRWDDCGLGFFFFFILFDHIEFFLVLEPSSLCQNRNIECGRHYIIATLIAIENDTATNCMAYLSLSPSLAPWSNIVHCRDWRNYLNRWRVLLYNFVFLCCRHIECPKMSACSVCEAAFVRTILTNRQKKLYMCVVCVQWSQLQIWTCFMWIFAIFCLFYLQNSTRMCSCSLRAFSKLPSVSINTLPSVLISASLSPITELENASMHATTV